MSVRRRIWTTSKGEQREAWVVAYSDVSGKPRLRTFSRKREADAYHAKVRVDVSSGVHVVDSQSVTVAEAGQYWIQTAEANSLERATIDGYRQHLNYHIVPYLGSMKLSRLTVPAVAEFRDTLRANARSPLLVKKVLASLSSILADAQERGLVTQNVVRSLTGRKKRTKATQKRKLEIGVDIPTTQEIKAIIGALQGRWRPVLLTAIFTGLRASELRGLTWENVDFEKREIRVRQRADRYNTIGAPKSEAGIRAVPLPPLVLNTLREWKLACPKGELGLVFPTGAGTIEALSNITNRGLEPVQISAGVTTADGKAKYGMHSLRHFYTSWCINRRADGGLELPAKVVQERLGHSSITMTMDRYGHLFPSDDHASELAAAEQALLA
jgi:integrase